MRILGVDPGTETTGYGLLDSGPEGRLLTVVTFGEISGATRRRPLPERLSTVFRGLAEVLARERPEEVVVEGVFYARNARAALTIGHVRGVVLLAAAECGLPVFEYAPPEVKVAVCGNGAAHKTQVQFMVRRVLGIAAPPRADEADALALGICHARRRAAEGIRELGQPVRPGRAAGRAAR